MVEEFFRDSLTMLGIKTEEDHRGFNDSVASRNSTLSRTPQGTPQKGHYQSQPSGKMNKASTDYTTLAESADYHVPRFESSPDRLATYSSTNDYSSSTAYGRGVPVKTESQRDWGSPGKTVYSSRLNDNTTSMRYRDTTHTNLPDNTPTQSYADSRIYSSDSRSQYTRTVPIVSPTLQSSSLRHSSEDTATFAIEYHSDSRSMPVRSPPVKSYGNTAYTSSTGYGRLGTDTLRAVSPTYNTGPNYSSSRQVQSYSQTSHADLRPRHGGQYSSTSSTWWRPRMYNLSTGESVGDGVLRDAENSLYSSKNQKYQSRSNEYPTALSEKTRSIYDSLRSTEEIVYGSGYTGAPWRSIITDHMERIEREVRATHPYTYETRPTPVREPIPQVRSSPARYQNNSATATQMVRAPNSPSDTPRSMSPARSMSPSFVQTRRSVSPQARRSVSPTPVVSYYNESREQLGREWGRPSQVDLPITYVSASAPHVPTITQTSIPRVTQEVSSRDWGRPGGAVMVRDTQVVRDTHVVQLRPAVSVGASDHKKVFEEKYLREGRVVQERLAPLREYATPSVASSVGSRGSLEGKEVNVSYEKYRESVRESKEEYKEVPQGTSPEKPARVRQGQQQQQQQQQEPMQSVEESTGGQQYDDDEDKEEVQKQYPHEDVERQPQQYQYQEQQYEDEQYQDQQYQGQRYQEQQYQDEEESEDEEEEEQQEGDVERQPQQYQYQQPQQYQEQEDDEEGNDQGGYYQHPQQQQWEGDSDDDEGLPPPSREYSQDGDSNGPEGQEYDSEDSN